MVDRALASRARFLLSAPRWDQVPDLGWPELAIAGRSNVGKSSLLNTLVGRRGLARTSSTPGRTQALNFFLVDERFVLVDLPGYGYAKAPATAVRRWTANTRSFVQCSPRLRGVVVLLDVRRNPSPEDLAFVDLVRSAGRILLPVATKCDKVGRGERLRRVRAIQEALGLETGALVLTSARLGEGRQALWSRLIRLVEGEDAPGAALPQSGAEDGVGSCGR